jgi:hypothetical protein
MVETVEPEKHLKRSRGFLGWGLLIIIAFLASGGFQAIGSGDSALVLASIGGIGLTAAICVLWFLFSGRREKRSWFPRIVGNLFFAWGTVVPMVALPEAAVPDALAEQVPLEGPNWLLGAGVVLLLLAYVLQFRKPQGELDPPPV